MPPGGERELAVRPEIEVVDPEPVVAGVHGATAFGGEVAVRMVGPREGELSDATRCPIH